MNRIELQQLAEERVIDAAVLLAAGRWSAAYYLAGYAVECALKACVMAHVERTGIIFRDRKFAEKCWTHDIEQLVLISGLKADRDRDAGMNPNLSSNWATVKDWAETSRYIPKDRQAAEGLLKAITDATHGVLPWIKNYW